MSSSAITGPVLSDNKRAPAGTAAAPSFAFNDSTGTGVYLVSPGVLGLSTAGVQRVVVDASGNVGVGVTPSAWASTFKSLQFGPRGALSDAVTGGSVYLSRNYWYNGTNNIYLQTGTSQLYSQENGGHIWFYAPSGTQGTIITYTQQMQLQSNGNLLVGPTADILSGPRLHISTNSAAGIGVAAAVNTNQASRKWSYGPDGNGNFLVFNDAGVGMFMTYGANGWTAGSDERMKKNIKPLELGLEQIKALKPARFDYNQDESESSARVGFIAQEVLPVLPHAVHVPEDSEQMMGVSATEMIPVLVKAIQELEARLAALEAK